MKTVRRGFVLVTVLVLSLIATACSDFWAEFQRQIAEERKRQSDESRFVVVHDEDLYSIGQRYDVQLLLDKKTGDCYLVVDEHQGLGVTQAPPAACQE